MSAKACTGDTTRGITKTPNLNLGQGPWKGLVQRSGPGVQTWCRFEHWKSRLLPRIPPALALANSCVAGNLEPGTSDMEHYTFTAPGLRRPTSTTRIPHFSGDRVLPPQPSPRYHFVCSPNPPLDCQSQKFLAFIGNKALPPHRLCDAPLSVLLTHFSTGEQFALRVSNHKIPGYTALLGTICGSHRHHHPSTSINHVLRSTLKHTQLNVDRVCLAP